jgi:hypothetical protein
MNNKTRLDDQETEGQKWKKKKTNERPKEAEQKNKNW